MAVVSWVKLKAETYRDKKDLRKRAVIRAAAVLTNTYVASNEVVISNFSKVAIFFNITQASLTSFEYKVQQSPDGGTTWYDIGAESVTLATITDGIPVYSRTLAGDDKWYKIVNAIGEHLRVQVQGTGTLTGCSCTVTVVGVY